MPEARVREYRTSDAPALARLYVESVEAIGPRDYSAPQVRAWLSLAPSPERIHDLSSDGRTMLVAVDRSGRPVAFGDLEDDGHIVLRTRRMEVSGVPIHNYAVEKVLDRQPGSGRP